MSGGLCGSGGGVGGSLGVPDVPSVPPQRQRWLRAAMAEALGGVSAGGPVAEVRRCLEVLGGGHTGDGDPPPAEAGAQEEALEQLGELVENMDVAQGWGGLGGPGKGGGVTGG